MRKAILYILTLCAVLCSCQDNETLAGDSYKQVIHIGGVTVADELAIDVAEAATRAAQIKDAEQEEWLINPLKSGLDITYGIANDKNTQKVAILKLTGGTETDKEYDKDPVSQWAIYSFNYRDGGDPAVWYGNGPHCFEGVYVPNNIRYGSGVEDADRTLIESVNTTSAPNILTDLHNDATETPIGNYRLLERYLGMPSNTRLSATVARIKLPFRHRLARVLAYVLIDPAMGTDVKLQGYKKSIADNQTDVEDEDPTNTGIRFCNVDMLEGVEDTKDSNGHHTLTPMWKNSRKVIPHYMGERASINSEQTVVDADNFVVYFNTNTDTYLFPTDDAKWVTAKEAYNAAYNQAPSSATEKEKEDYAKEKSKYHKIVYGKVPVYDIILRPTYTSVDNVMYDEKGVKNDNGTENIEVKQTFNRKTNQIDFDLVLNNGLEYFKNVAIDLDANKQTIIYLRISRESIDYNSSGSELWVSEMKEDDWYGVDNLGGHSLSDAGSSWQRAFTLGEFVSYDKVTDGGYYNETTSTDVNTKGQYLNDATWIEMFAQAYEGGANHGDYFTLKKDITIDASALPIDFVFTGHLDAQGHTITLTGTNSWAECTNEVFTLLRQGQSEEETIPQLYYVNETAQAQLRRTRAIEYGEPVELDMVHTTPADLNPNLTYLYKNAEGKYEEYHNRTFYKKTGSALFYGLNGIYSTKQETEEKNGNPIYNQGWEWEANVHKENNVWVPYRDVASDDTAEHTGWRAEVINLKIKGNLFETDAVVTGNVQNCYQGTNSNIKVKDHKPSIPKYN